MPCNVKKDLSNGDHGPALKWVELGSNNGLGAALRLRDLVASVPAGPVPHRDCVLGLLDGDKEVATIGLAERDAADVVLEVSLAQRVHGLQAHRVPDPHVGALEGAAGLSSGDQQLVRVDGHALDVGGVAEVVPLGLLLHVVEHHHCGHEVHHLPSRQKVQVGTSISTSDNGFYVIYRITSCRLIKHYR